MRRTSLYSRSVRPAAAPPSPVTSADQLLAQPAEQVTAATRPATSPPPASSARASARFTGPMALWAAIVLLGLTWCVTVLLWLENRPPTLTQQDIDHAVRHTLESQPLPSATAKAYETIAPSVVRVVGLMSEGDDYVPERDTPKEKERNAAPGAQADAGGAPEHPPVEASPAASAPLMGPAAEPQDPPRGQGTGVVIVDTGVILTNFHVVHGAKRIKVEFHNGLVADADLIGLHPEHDLAVLKAQKIPDDLPAATLRSTGGLRPGDQVAAVGFPFGIGPSVSAGVVSGLRREFRSPQGERMLTNLIQFDAAANPGNSGGPLITMEGEVVGIVTAILNPTEQRTFIGIGFAVPIENAAAMAGLPPF